MSGVFEVADYEYELEVVINDLKNSLAFININLLTKTIYLYIYF